MVNYYHANYPSETEPKGFMTNVDPLELCMHLSSGGFNVTTNAAQSNNDILNKFQYKYMRLLQREQIAFLLIYHLVSGYFTRIRRVGTKMCKYLG